MLSCYVALASILSARIDALYQNGRRMYLLTNQKSTF